MQGRISHHNISAFFSNTSVSNILLIKNHYFVAQSNYVEDQLYQKIKIFDLNMKLVAELLADQCFITSMDLIDNHYLAVTYHTNKNLSHTLGIWDIHQVIAGQQNPFRTFPLNASDYNPKLLGLSNQKVAYANIPSATIDFYDFKEKLFSFTMKQWCGYHSLKFTNTANDCVIASINDATQNIEIHVIDLHTQKLKHNFLLNQTKRVDELKHFEITHNKYLFFTYLASDPESNGTPQRKKYSEIWDIHTNECIKTLDINIVEIKKFPNEDIVFLTKEGGVEYWGFPFEKKSYEVHFPKARAAFLDVIVLDNYALIIDHIYIFAKNTERFFYIPPPLPLLQMQYEIVNLVVNIIAPYAKIPQINQLIHEYLGFFKPKKYCGLEFSEDKELKKPPRP